MQIKNAFQLLFMISVGHVRLRTRRERQKFNPIVWGQDWSRALQRLGLEKNKQEVIKKSVPQVYYYASIWNNIDAYEQEVLY